MDRNDISWEQEQNASNIDKSLMRRTEALDNDLNSLKVDITNVKTVIGDVSGSGSTISSTIDDISSKQERFQLELNILHLSSLGKINAGEHRRLLMLLNSPDKENWNIAKEIVTNKISEL